MGTIFRPVIFPSFRGVCLVLSWTQQSSRSENKSLQFLQVTPPCCLVVDSEIRLIFFPFLCFSFFSIFPCRITSRSNRKRIKIPQVRGGI
ncbi:hypothetical protein I7I48_08699 [Histoplasma ohiense]|nr:hypothetical protein I7I48_08699 [Histoplasma ohiense (nom. inval.)]